MLRLCCAGFVLLGVVGCGAEPPPLVMATSPEKAKALLVTTLDAWKAGSNREQLAALSPPVYFLDAQLVKGAKLTDYQIDDQPHVVGTGVTYVVTLTTRTGTKASASKKVAYRVVTQPSQSISQEDAMP